MNANPWLRLLVVFSAIIGLSVHAQEAKDAERLLHTFKGDKPVNDVAFSPDGKQLVSAGRDGTVRIWDAATGKELHNLRGHGEHTVQGVAFSPDGKWLASAGWDEKVVLWNAATGENVRTHDVAGGGELASSVVFSPDSKWLVAAGELVAAGFDESIYIWDVATGKVQRKLKGHVNGIFSVTFSRDGKLLATAGSQDGDIILWDFATGQKLKTLEPRSKRIWQVAFSPDQKTLVSGGEDGMIRVWDVATGKELRKFQGHARGVMSVAFHPDGKLLASAGRGGSVKFWEFDSGKELHAFKGHAGAVKRIVFHPDGKKLASASFDQTVKLWEVAAILAGQKGNPQETKAAEQLVRTFKGHTKQVVEVAFSRDGKRLASAGDDATVRIWELATGKELHTLRGHGQYSSHAVAFSPDGKWLASAGWDQKVVLWDAATGKNVRTHEARGGGEWAGSVTFSPDSKWLLTAGELVPAGLDEIIPIWEVSTGNRQRTLKGHGNGIFSISLSPDGKLLASSGSVEEIILWDFATGQVLQTIKGRSSVAQVVFSPDGKVLAARGDEGPIQVWEVTGGKELRKLRAFGTNVGSMAFSQDGKLLASAGGKDSKVTLWDFDSGKELRSFKAHTGAVWRVVFHPDGRQLASAGADQTVKLWDVSGLVAARNERKVEPVRVTLILPRFPDAKRKGHKQYPEVQRAIERLPSVKLEQNLLPFGPAGLKKEIGLEIGVQFDPTKADVGDLARAIAALPVDREHKDRPALILLFVPREGDIPTRLDLTEAQRGKVREALARLKGIEVKRSQGFVEASAVGIVLDEKGGGKLQAIKAGLASAGVDVETGFRDPLLP